MIVFRLALVVEVVLIWVLSVFGAVFIFIFLFEPYFVGFESFLVVLVVVFAPTFFCPSAVYYSYNLYSSSSSLLRLRSSVSRTSRLSSFFYLLIFSFSSSCKRTRTVLRCLRSSNSLASIASCTSWLLSFFSYDTMS